MVLSVDSLERLNKTTEYAVAVEKVTKIHCTLGANDFLIHAAACRTLERK